jgi:leucyl aminopeptidase
MLNVIFDIDLSDYDAIAIFVDKSLELDKSLLLFDQENHGIISKTINIKHMFNGEFGEIKHTTFIAKNGLLKQLFFVGIGESLKLDESDIEKLGGKILSTATIHKISNLSVNLKYRLGRHDVNKTAALIASGALLRSYKFNKYKTKQKEQDKFSVTNIEILTDNIQETSSLYYDMKILAEAVMFAKNICNEPSNIKSPEYYSNMIVDVFEPFGVKVKVLSEREMKNLGMGAILGVGQGSHNESKLVVMEYNNLDEDTAPLVLVGKGVTFDSGGISLKPAANMEDMKYDMSGSATVVGTILALAGRLAKVHVVGVVGLVENMPSGTAQRPGDIVKTMSGQTVEVLNTDAEGRLVLADAVWYAQEKYKPSFIIDIATLTGAVVVALGSVFAGCFSNDNDLADKLIEAGDHVNEKLWRLPLHKKFDEELKSQSADIANISSGRGAGSSMGAHFIGRFIQDGVKWAHLDIAGVDSSKKPSSISSEGSKAFGVRLLNQFIKDNYEQK